MPLHEATGGSGGHKSCIFFWSILAAAMKRRPLAAPVKPLFSRKPFPAAARDGLPKLVGLYRLDGRPTRTGGKVVKQAKMNSPTRERILFKRAPLTGAYARFPSRVQAWFKKVSGSRRAKTGQLLTVRPISGQTGTH